MARLIGWGHDRAEAIRRVAVVAAALHAYRRAGQTRLIAPAPGFAVTLGPETVPVEVVEADGGYRVRVGEEWLDVDARSRHRGRCRS